LFYNATALSSFDKAAETNIKHVIHEKQNSHAKYYDMYKVISENSKQKIVGCGKQVKFRKSKSLIQQRKRVLKTPSKRLL
jgi:hypothetical protein